MTHDPTHAIYKYRSSLVCVKMYRSIELNWVILADGWCARRVCVHICTYSRNNMLNRKGRKQRDKTITHQLWPICSLNSIDTVRCWHIPQRKKHQKSVWPWHYKLYDSFVHDFRRTQRIISKTYSFPYFTRFGPIELTPYIMM